MAVRRHRDLRPPWARCAFAPKRRHDRAYKQVAIRTIVSLTLGGALLVTGCALAAGPSTPPPAGSRPVAWARIGTADAHSLAFAPSDSEHLYFGHHGGILESRDGGMMWQPLDARADAMSMAMDGSAMYIAGHDVLQVSRDGGVTWDVVEADLPSLDIHAFAQDPGDAQRLWAYLAEGGVYESTDGGALWRRVFDGHVPFLYAVTGGDQTRLLGLDPMAGIVQSDDDGATWTLLSAPPSSPVVSLAATPDGTTLLLGAGDGLYRSDDGGATWRRILLTELPLAIAAYGDGSVVAAVTRRTDYYRSDDGGASWPGP